MCQPAPTPRGTLYFRTHWPLQPGNQVVHLPTPSCLPFPIHSCICNLVGDHLQGGLSVLSASTSWGLCYMVWQSQFSSQWNLSVPISSPASFLLVSPQYLETPSTQDSQRPSERDSEALPTNQPTSAILSSNPENKEWNTHLDSTEKSDVVLIALPLYYMVFSPCRF